MKSTYTVILSPDPIEGGYTVVCPAMPGAITEGDSREEALRAMAEVISIWLEVADEHGEQPLDETPELLAEKVAEVLEDRAEEGWDFRIETTAVEPEVSAVA